MFRPTRRPPRRQTAVRASSLLLVTGFVFGGCYHYHVDAVNQPVGINADQRGESEVLWSLAWGAAQENFDTSQSCKGLPLKSVTTHSNLGFSLITVLSLGFASPVTVTWTCGKETTPVIDSDNDPNDPI